ARGSVSGLSRKPEPLPSEFQASCVMSLISSGKGWDGTANHAVRMLFRLGRNQSWLALLPIAGAEFVGLQRVQYAQDFLDVAAYRQVGDRYKADDPVWINDKSGSLRHAFLGIENAQCGGQLALDISEHGELQVTEVLMIVPPCKMYEF